METTEIILYIAIAFVILVFIRKFYLARKIRQYNPSEIRARMKPGNSLLLLDVRTDQERKASKINGSIHIPLHELMRRMKELEKFRGKEIVCYCRSGNRSLTAASKLIRSGFTAANLKGGINNW